MLDDVYNGVAVSVNRGVAAWDFLANTLNRPARQTIADHGRAMIPLPDRGQFQDWWTTPPQKKDMQCTADAGAPCAVRTAGCFPPPVATGLRVLNSAPQAALN